MSEPIYLVYDVDGTSATGARVLIGGTTNRAVADAVAADVAEKNSWHSGHVVAVDRLEAR